MRRRVALIAAGLAPLVPFTGGGEAARPPVPRGEIFVVGADGRGRQNLTRTAASESEIALSPDGRRIAYVRSDGIRSQIWVMNVDGSGQRRLTTGEDEERAPAWSPDGRRLVYMVWDYGGCYPGATKCAVTDAWTIDADGREQRKILDSALHPRWSPGGRRLLFQRFESNVSSSGLYVASSDGTAVTLLVRAVLWGAELVPAAWDPGGKKIVYGQNFGPPPGVRLSTVTADGRRRRTLTSGWAPVWAPDGSRIAFARRSGIWVIPSRGGRPRRIAAETGRQHRSPSPAWSPAGKQLAFITGRELFVARVDGRSTKRVAQGAAGGRDVFLTPPVWSRNGRRLYYSS
jgi:Tol biopolymer transport system component